VSDPSATGRPEHYGLAPRPTPSAEVLAVIAAAVQEGWPRPAAFADVSDPAHRVWRFSGRWWNKPIPMRRDRP
jgi:hypothetical protein